MKKLIYLTIGLLQSLAVNAQEFTQIIKGSDCGSTGGIENV